MVSLWHCKCVGLWRKKVWIKWMLLQKCPISIICYHLGYFKQLYRHMTGTLTLLLWLLRYSHFPSVICRLSFFSNPYLTLQIYYNNFKVLYKHVYFIWCLFMQISSKTLYKWNYESKYSIIFWHMEDGL